MPASRTLLATALVLTAALGAGCRGETTTAVAPAPQASSTSPATSDTVHDVDRLEGDMDGDGSDDTVRLGVDGSVTVELTASEEPVLAHLKPGSTLLGLPEIGDRGTAIAAQHGGAERRTTTVLRLSPDGLTRVRTADRAWLGSSRDQAAWVSDDARLLVGALRTRGTGRTAVYPHVWQLGQRGAKKDTLVPRQAGAEYCWDRESQAHPEPCPPGTSYGPHVGSATGLPELFPAVGGRRGVGEPLPFTLAGVAGTATLRGSASPDEVAAGDVRLVVRTGVFRDRGPVPAGWTPVLVGRLSLPHEGIGFVVSQEGGDSDTWTVFVPHQGALVRARVPAEVPFGGGFTADGTHAYLSWVSPRGRLYTRVGLDRADHYRLWSWSVEGTTLDARDLGVVCLDLMAQPERYGSC